MVRLAELRRYEALEMIERINKYNLAIIAFAGSFLSLLATADVEIYVVRFAGVNLILSIITSLLAVRPERVKGGALDVEEDVSALRNNEKISTEQYLLDVAVLTNDAARSLQLHANAKKKGTIIAALFLAFSLIVTYILVSYA